MFGEFGILEYSRKPIKELSTGMSQKVSLILALVNDPDVILFDEPTNGLDIIAAKQVMSYLIKLKKIGKTVILSSHIFELIEATCDRIAILLDGEISYCGSLDEITSKKRLDEFFFDFVEEV